MKTSDGPGSLRTANEQLTPKLAERQKRILKTKDITGALEFAFFCSEGRYEFDINEMQKIILRNKNKQTIAEYDSQFALTPGADIPKLWKHIQKASDLSAVLDFARSYREKLAGVIDYMRLEKLVIKSKNPSLTIKFCLMFTPSKGLITQHEDNICKSMMPENIEMFMYAVPSCNKEKLKKRLQLLRIHEENEKQEEALKKKLRFKNKAGYIYLSHRGVAEIESCESFTHQK